MKRKKIGFVRDETDPEGKNLGDMFKKLSATSKAELIQFIEANFCPAGSSEQKQFMTTTEIEYMLRESISTSSGTINDVMNSLGFEITYIENLPSWTMYSKHYTNYDEIVDESRLLE